jgi:hypothetical protein
MIAETESVIRAAGDRTRRCSYAPVLFDRCVLG